MPTETFYRRPLPEPLIAFASAEGRQLFAEALAGGTLDGWFPLAEQFHTQSDPSFCGLGSLVVALNALEIDPGRIWRGPWRWYGEDLLDCCHPLDDVRARGITLEQLASLARCNGARADLVRADTSSEDALRDAVRRAASTARGEVLLASYSRKALGQTGDGHFSPVGGYHAGRDLALILDVARFKYPPHWVPVSALWRGVSSIDPETGKSRGWMVLARSERAAAVAFRALRTADGAAQARLLLERLPELLQGSASDPAAMVSTLRDRLGALCGCVAGGATTASASDSELAPAHRAAVDQLLAELRATLAYQLVTIEGAPRPPLCDEALAMILLALPDDILAGLPADARREFDRLRDPGAGCAALAPEIAAVREQLRTLASQP